jgi:fumarate hydratase subunit alpha
MREIPCDKIVQTVRDLCIRANYGLGPDVAAALKKARAREDTPLAGRILDQLIENARIAREGVYPLCQDTGMAVVFIER